MRRRPRVALVLGITLVLLGGLLPGGSPPAQAFEWAGRLKVITSKLRSPKDPVRLKAVRQLGEFPMKQVQRHLLRATADLEDSVRIEAARILARNKVKAVIGVLKEWLSDFELSVRVEAVNLLGELGDPSVVPALIRTFGDFEHKVRKAAVVALGKIGSRKAVAGILGRLDDPNVRVRQEAIQVLSALVDARSVIPLLGKLNDPSREIRKAAVQTLAKLADHKSVPAIIRLLKDPAESVRVAAMAALGQFRYPLAAVALIDAFDRSRSTTERRAAIQALSRLNAPEADRAMIKAIKDSNLREAVRTALVWAGGRVVKQLARYLSSPRVSQAEAAFIVSVLQEIGDKRASRALVGEFRRERISRKLVVEALGRCGDANAVVPLLLVVTGKEKALRLQALRALENIVDRRAIVPLLPVLKSKDTQMRLAGVRIMGKLKARAAIPQLLEILRKDSADVRAGAAIALGRIGDPRVGRRLVPLLFDRAPALQRAAFNALAALRPRAVVRELLQKATSEDARLQHRALALDAVAAVLRSSRSNTHAQAILGLVDSKNAALASAALTAIAAIRSPMYGPALLHRVKKASRRLQVKMLETLGYLPSPATRRLFEQLLTHKGWRHRATAIWALGRMGARAPLKAILRGLSDRHVAVRTNAAGVLARLGNKAARQALRRVLDPDRDPYLLANVILALGRLGDRRSRSLITGLLRSGMGTVVLHQNAVRALHALGLPKAQLMALIEKTADEPVRRLAEAIYKRRPGRPPVRVARKSWIGLTLVNNQGNRMRGAPAVLGFPDGVLRWILTDERGQAYEEMIPAGQVFFRSMRKRRR